MELREKIASLFAVARRAGAENKPGDPDDFAALVLSIPEIAEALGRSYKGMVIVEDASLKPGEMKLVQKPNA